MAQALSGPRPRWANVWRFQRHGLRDEENFLTDRIGKKLFGDNINIVDQVGHPLQSGMPFDGEGVPRQSVTLVENGAVRSVVYCRQAAHLSGTKPTGHGFPLPNEIGEAPMNIVIMRQRNRRLGK